ncbi:MAG: Ig-like domain-containing protein, partial [Actinobacteria bacterium]|nr:Ig-like domain-containing protein [Actinomycetota bacterium]
ISPAELTVGGEAVISVTARDAQNNPLSGIEDEIQVAGAGDATVSIFTEDEQAGVYTATLVNTNPGELSLTITVSGVTLDEVLFVTFLTGGADTIEIVSGNNQSASVSSELPNPIVVRVTDAFDNPVEGEGVTFEFDETPPAAVGRSIEPESVQTNSDGEASAVVTLGSIPGTYTVAASAENTGSVTFDLQATIGQASAITIINQPSNTVAGDPISPVPAVEITDDEGNGIEGISVDAELEGGNFAGGSSLQATTNNSGVATFDNLIITDAGSDYTIRFIPAPSSVSDVTSETFEISAAAADPVNSTADVPNGSAGDQTDITITVLDIFGNPVEGVASELSLAINVGVNSGAQFTSVSDEGNGIYQAGYTPSATGTDQITIELDGVGIDGSPFTSNIVATDAENVEITQQPQNSIAGQIIGGSPAVLVTDNLANAIENVEVTVSVDGGANFSGGTVTRTTNSAGAAVFDDLLIETAGSFELRFNALGVSQDAVSESFTVSPADAEEIVRVSGNNQTAPVTEQLDNPFVVRVEDPFGNPVSGETVVFSIETTPQGSSGESLSSESVTTNSSGEATSTLTLGSVIGGYSVTASSGTGSVQFSAQAIAGAAASFEFDAISSPQVAGNPFVILITAFDEEGNVAEGYSGTATLSTTAGSISPGSISISDGEGSTNVSVSQAGSDQTITATDGSISGTSNEFDVQTGGASDAEITQQPTNTTAGQTISPSPAVEVTDAQGNPVSGVNVEADLSSGSFVTSSTTQTTNNSGIAVFGNLSIEAAGSYTIVFDVQASGVNDPESVQFAITPTEADPQNTDASVPNGVAGEETTILITAEDAFGNRVDGIASELAISISGANSATPSAEPAGNGQYEAIYIPSNSGSDQVVIELNGSSISRSPYSSTVSTSDISSGESSVSANLTSLQAGSTSQVTIQLRDGSGNLISGLGNSDFSINVSGNGNAGSVSESSTGTYQFNVRNTTAQQVTVSVNNRQ